MSDLAILAFTTHANPLEPLNSAMADNATSDSSPKEEATREPSKEDDETRAARQELNKSSISDRLPSVTTSTAGADKDAHPATPPADQPDVQHNDSVDQILSPKKKRAHDQLDADKDAEDDDAKSTTSTDSAKGRATRLEPEKKRHRDAEAAEKETVRCQELTHCPGPSTVVLTQRLIRGN